jgi:hypothetical protein
MKVTTHSIAAALLLMSSVLLVSIAGCCECDDDPGTSANHCCRLVAVDTCGCDDLSWNSTAQAALSGGDDSACHVALEGVLDDNYVSTAEDLCIDQGDPDCYRDAVEMCN